MVRSSILRFGISPIILASLALACGGGGGGGGEGTDTDTDTSGETAVPGESSGGEEEGSGTTTGSADESDSGEDEGTDTTGGASLEGLIEALCNYEFACCSRGELDYRLGPFTDDAAECTARYIQQLDSNNNDDPVLIGSLLDSLAYSIRLERVDVDAAALSACIEAVQARECNAPVDGETRCEAGEGDDPCALDSLFFGRQQVGDVCNPNLFPDVECAAGSKCVAVSGDIGECEKRAVADEFCSSADDCDDGLFCDFSEGKCAPKGDVGDACAFEDPNVPTPGTETRQCLDHLTCDPDTETCTAYCSEGYDCSADAQCPAGLSCVPMAPGSPFNYCASTGNAGAACDTKADCASGHYCAGENCALSKNVGDTCASTEECVTGYCNITCQNFEGVGDPCTSDLQCDPATTVGCFTSDDGTLCRAAKLPNDSICVGGQDSCASGVCDATPTGQRCIVGEQEGDDCDESAATTSVNLCAEGLYCDTDSVCKTKGGAGATCEEDGSVMCLSGSCDPSAPWDEPMCTDAPESSDAVTCDGME